MLQLCKPCYHSNRHTHSNTAICVYMKLVFGTWLSWANRILCIMLLLCKKIATMDTDIYIHNSAVCRPVMSIVGMLAQRDNIVYEYKCIHAICRSMKFLSGTFWN